MRNLSWNQRITKCNNNINSAEVWRRINAAKGTAPRPPTHSRPQKEADSLCDSFAQSCSSEKLPEHTTNILTNIVPERVRAITTATYEAVDTDQKFTLSEFEDVLCRLKDTAPGDDTVCNSMIKNVPLDTSSSDSSTSYSQRRDCPLDGKWPRVYRSQRKTKRIVPFHYFRLFRKSGNDWC